MLDFNHITVVPSPSNKIHTLAGKMKRLLMSDLTRCPEWFRNKQAPHGLVGRYLQRKNGFFTCQPFIL